MLALGREPHKHVNPPLRRAISQRLAPQMHLLTLPQNPINPIDSHEVGASIIVVTPNDRPRRLSHDTNNMSTGTPTHYRITYGISVIMGDSSIFF